MGANLAPASTRCCRCSADSCAAWGLLSICWFIDRKSTRLNSSHSQISYAVFCLKKKKAPSFVFGDATAFYFGPWSLRIPFTRTGVTGSHATHHTHTQYLCCYVTHYAFCSSELS